MKTTTTLKVVKFQMLLLAGKVVGISPFLENVQITTLVDIIVVIKNIL